MLLTNLLCGKEPSNLVLLQDSADVSARPLLCCFIKSLLARVDIVYIVLFELSPAKILSHFDQDNKTRIQVIDGFSDPLCWEPSLSRHPEVPQINKKMGIVNTLRRSIKEKCSSRQNRDAAVKVSIVIDSMSRLIDSSPTQSCQILHQLARGHESYQIEQIVGLIHHDLRDDLAITALNSVCSSILHVQTDSTQTDEIQTFCKILHKRKTGKILKKKQAYDINQDFELTASEEQDWQARPADAKPTESFPDKMVDPTSNLTFKLKLTREELNTHLPFMHHTKTPIAVTGDKFSEESQIFYQPDDADDFDEDDPDDDLDI